MKVKSDHRSKFTIYAIGRKKPEKYVEFIKLTLLSTCGLTAQLVEHRGLNPVEAMIFFRLLPSNNCLNWKFTAMITLHFNRLNSDQETKLSLIATPLALTE